MTFREALRDWAMACKIAEENPSLLIADGSRKTSKLCEQRMKDIDSAWLILMTFRDDEVTPKMRGYRYALQNSACSKCWFSSSGATHAACEFKIKKYFETKAALIAEGLEDA